jgi:hypothetical protein
VALSLDAALRSAGIGRAALGVAEAIWTSAGKPRFTHIRVHVYVWGDLEKGIALLRRTLREIPAPRETTVDLRFPARRSIPWWD